MRILPLLFCWALAVTFAAGQCVQPLEGPAAADWRALSFLNPDTGFLAGPSGALWQTLDGGASWLERDARTGTRLNSLCFPDGQLGWAVGDRGVIRQTTDGGASWSQQFSPLGADLNSIHCWSANLGLIAGACGTLMRTTDGGAAWTWADAGTEADLLEVHWVNAQVALAVGTAGTVLRSADAGQTWLPVGGTGSEVQWVLLSQSDTVWLSGAGGTQRSVDAGLTWSSVSPRSFRDLALAGNGRVLGVSAEGTVAISQDGGFQWAVLSEAEGWSALSVAANQEGYLAGPAGAFAEFRWLEGQAEGPEQACQGDFVALQGNTLPGPAAYIWSGPEGFMANSAAVFFAPPASGWYTYTLDVEGCTAADSVFITVEEAPAVELGETIFLCDGETTVLHAPAGDFNYAWSTGAGAGSLPVSEAGDYAVTVTNPSGCASADTVTVEVGATANYLLDTLLCPGASVWVNGVQYDDANPAGSEVLAGAAANGCDSVVTVQLEFSFVEPIAIDTAVCPSGFPFVYLDNLIEAPGSYVWPTTNADGCPQQVFLGVQEAPGYEVTVADSICPGQAYAWHGQMLTEPGAYMVALTAADGCDSLVTLVLAERQPIVEVLPARICEGAEVVIGGFPFDESGDYEVMLVSEAGCDSIVQLSLEVLPPDTALVQAAICDGEAYTWQGEGLQQAGMYEALLTNEAGCDSLVQLELSVFSVPVLLVEATLPDDGSGNGSVAVAVLNGAPPYSLSWSNGGTGFMQSGLPAGTYTVTVVDANGCSDVLQAEVPMASGVSGAAMSQLGLWPNPAAERLFIRWPAQWPPAATEVRIYDSLGRLCKRWSGGSIPQPVPLQLPPGAYWVELSCQGRGRAARLLLVQ